jgi:hypothetical protein
MAPRTGPQGVTIEDVARRAGVGTYVKAPPNQPPPIDASTLANFLIGGQAPGYGRKYGGFPTAGYGQAAIEGQAYQIADLARQAQALAAARQAELESAAGQDIAQSRSAIASKYRYDYQPSAEVQQAGSELQAAETPLAQMLARAKMKSVMGEEQGGRRAELTALETPIQSKFESDVAQQVAPARGIGEALGSFTPSQLAQQIAVSRYGYDPMLASGLFGAQTDLGYASQQQAIQDAQLRAMGYNTGLSTDEILAQQLSPEEFQQYQINKALGSYENTMTDYTQEDQNLFSAYGVVPSNDMERQVMLDPKFYNIVEQSKTAMMEQSGVNPTAAASAIARQYLIDNPNQTARAVMLEDILRNYAFVIEDPTSGYNIVLPNV